MYSDDLSSFYDHLELRKEEKMEYGILSIIPTLIAVGLALTTKNVYISLLLGLFIGNVVIFDGNVLAGVDRCV